MIDILEVEQNEERVHDEENDEELSSEESIDESIAMTSRY